MRSPVRPDVIKLVLVDSLIETVHILLVVKLVAIHISSPIDGYVIFYHRVRLFAPIRRLVHFIFDITK